ncbi:Gfo/Idh/MocA family oxidoreductase [Paenibacillus sp. MWE-103]|uniref:Gfo/Idh/MocA family oxidoreductase n=1 Tax=Paenibacillus artemisiicola TaxID=1172618 RepID=A0ABS3W5V4_9BACL|nr:Gfo/Idh/MocA family oxidoreductase [Paenibacillus artemisiicola]MBO7743702.1 Gfo/Idh/MocA family oxidoreductase [Paenibacillus artemisiicola]
MRRVKVGIIGQGRSGRDIHAATMMNMPELFEIVAISDPVPERRERARKELRCDVAADDQDLYRMSDIELIVNATPSHMHVPVSIACMQRGFHVLCEKPLARWTADVDRLIEVSNQTGQRVAVYHQLRFAPAFRKLCDIIDSGRIGRVVQASLSFNGFSRRWDWQTLQEKNGGNLLNTGAHAVDQGVRLFGQGGQPEVFCLMDRANSFGDAEDYVKLILHGAGRPTVDIELSSCSAYPGAAYVVQGTHGGIKGTHGRLDWKYFKPEEAPAQRLITEALQHADGTPAYCSEQLTWYEESWEPANEREANPYTAAAESYYRALYNTIALGEPLPITLEEVRRQIRVIEQCFEQNEAFASKHRKSSGS